MSRSPVTAVLPGRARRKGQDPLPGVGRRGRVVGAPLVIYKGFGTKAALAKAVFDLVIAGDDEAVPVAERPAMRAVRDEPDVRRKMALFTEGLAQRQARSARVQILIRDGRHVDDSLAPVWAKLNDEGLAGMTMLGRHLLETGQLRDGIGLDEVQRPAIGGGSVEVGANTPLRRVACGLVISGSHGGMCSWAAMSASGMPVGDGDRRSGARR